MPINDQSGHLYNTFWSVTFEDCACVYVHVDVVSTPIVVDLFSPDEILTTAAGLKGRYSIFSPRVRNLPSQNTNLVKAVTIR